MDYAAWGPRNSVTWLAIDVSIFRHWDSHRADLEYTAMCNLACVAVINTAAAKCHPTGQPVDVMGPHAESNLCCGPRPWPGWISWAPHPNLIQFQLSFKSID